MIENRWIWNNKANAQEEMKNTGNGVSSVQSLNLCLTLCDPMDCNTPGFSVHHKLPELAETPVYRVGVAIQPSHPLSPSSPPDFNLAQHQGLFQ